MLLFPVEALSPRDLAFAVLDLETTGGSPKGYWNRQDRHVPSSEITEVGVVVLTGFVIQEHWESLCAIEGPLPQGIQRLTGITLPMLASAPTWERTALELASRLEGVAEVRKVAEMAEQGYFGPVVSSVFRGHAGDLVILPYRGESVWWFEQDNFEQKFRGHHGGLTPQEMEIPLITWEM